MKILIQVFLILVIGLMPLEGCSNRPADAGKASAPSSEEYRPKEIKEIGDNLKTVTFESKALGKDMCFNIYLPEGYSNEKKYPVLYLFHGYTGSNDTWMPNLNLDKRASELIKTGKIEPVIIVTPDIENSFGINSDKTYKALYGNDRKTNLCQGMFEDYIVKEIIPYVDANFSTISDRESRYIGGFSMGGYVALHIAFNHNDLFSKVGGHSPAVYFYDSNEQVIPWLYPNDELRKKRDPLVIAKEKDLSNLSVYLDCGDKDELKLYEGCEVLYDILQSKGVTSQYHLNPGDHDGKYWMDFTDEYLMFYVGKK